MPSKGKITEEMYVMCKKMLSTLLRESTYIGAGYVIQLLYELSVVVASYEGGQERCQDKFLRALLPDCTLLVMCRNAINHNSYNEQLVTKTVNEILDSKIVYDLYMKIFGEVSGYKIFEAECYRYLEYMKRIWRTK